MGATESEEIDENSYFSYCNDETNVDQEQFAKNFWWIVGGLASIFTLSMVLLLMGSHK
jgi:Trk-type K+ transport system membrane component